MKKICSKGGICRKGSIFRCGTVLFMISLSIVQKGRTVVSIEKIVQKENEE